MAVSGSGVARLRVLDTLALALSRLLPRCNRLMCRTTAVALNACWRKKRNQKKKNKPQKKGRIKKSEVEGLVLLLSWLLRVARTP